MKLRSTPLRAAGGLLLVFAACSSVEMETGRPNLLVIVADDLGYNDVSFHGATEIETPHLDALAESGVIFTNGYVTAPTCGPSRVGLLTGRYPARSGSEHNWAYAPFDEEHGLPVEEKTFATHLRRAGYRTGLVGKWQLGAAQMFHPLRRGFDEFFGFLAGDRNYYDAEPYPGSLWTRLPLLDGRHGSGFTGYLTDALTDRAVEFISRERTTPFLLVLSYHTPHDPLRAPPELVGKFAHIADEDRRTYLAMVHALDRGVGRVIEALETTGQRRDTLVFFLSDNGGVAGWTGAEDYDWADNAPFRGGKTEFLEGGIRVPFIASWPGRWPSGTTFDPKVISLDIAATALELAGASGSPTLPLDGVNLDPFVRGDASGPPHEALFWRLSDPPERRPAFAVRVGDRKLVRGRFGNAELFDLNADPGETRDLGGAEPATVERLSDLWNAWNRENLGPRFVNEETYRRRIEVTRSALAEAGKFRAATAPVQIGSPDYPRECAAAPGVEGDLVADCVSLMAFRDALRGAGSEPDWSTDRPLGGWLGVTVSGQPERVRELKLPERGLDGRISYEIRRLSALEVLDLSGNRLRGELPPGLGRLGRLRVLDLSGNQLSGALPRDLIGAENLSELSLADNRFTGTIPPEFADAPPENILRLGGNRLSGCVPPSLMEVGRHDLEALGLPLCDP